MIEQSPMQEAGEEMMGIKQRELIEAITRQYRMEKLTTEKSTFEKKEIIWWCLYQKLSILGDINLASNQ